MSPISRYVLRKYDTHSIVIRLPHRLWRIGDPSNSTRELDYNVQLLTDVIIKEPTALSMQSIYSFRLSLVARYCGSFYNA